MLIDRLESRTLLASDLSITGTSIKDVLLIRQTNASVSSAALTITNGGSGLLKFRVGATVDSVAGGASKSVTGIRRILIIDLGSGNDRCTLDPSVKVSANISGSNGRDTITGGSGDDIIAGDQARGAEFNDIIYGGPGNDTLYGYGGRDELYGQAGNDSIRGGIGSDQIDGGSGADKLFGEANNDFFFIVDGAQDSIDGGSGNDSSQPANADQDQTVGVESIAAAAGTDNANGTAFTVSGSGLSERIFAFVDDNDTLHVEFDGVAITYTFAQRSAALVGAVDGDPSRIFILGGGGDDTMTAGFGVERLYGDAGNDQLTSISNFEPAQINGRIFTLVGGPGDDFLRANRHQQSNLGGDEDLFRITVSGDSYDGDDTLIGSEFADQFEPGLGADYIRFGKAHLGPSPNDSNELLFSSDSADHPDTGRDTLDFSDRDDNLMIEVDASNRRVDVDGADGRCELFPEPFTPVIIGGSAADTIIGSSAADIIDGRGGNDVIQGNGGNDQLTGGSGHDILSGGNGSDLFFNADGSIDTIVGGAGKDRASRADGDKISTVEILR